jgi:hypothetical protein
VLEIKSGPPARSHRIQTALQCYLAALGTPIQPALIARFALHLKENGRFQLVQHKDTGDFVEARRVIQTCCER